MKYLPLIVIVLLVLGVGGYFFLSQKNKMAPQGASTSVKTETKDGNMFTSIKDALSKSLSLQCNYTDDAGTTSKTYIKAGAVRTEVAAKGDKETQTYMIMKDKKIYSWNPVTKQGQVIDISSFEISPKVIPSGVMKQEADEKEDQQASVLAQIEKYKDACKPATVADSLFVPPTDVTFQDYSKMMKQVQEKMTAPSGAVPSGFNIEDLKKQYMPQ